MLSASGARGLVGRSMTPSVASDLAAAFGSETSALHAGSTVTICVGRDGRASGAELAAAAHKALAQTGCMVVDLGVVTTPTVGVMTRELAAQGGLVITASHNPIEWNGIKCLDSNGLAPPTKLASRIIDRFKERRFDFVHADEVGSIGEDDRGSRIHVDRVLSIVDCEAIRDKEFTVVLDSVNASGSVAGKMLLEELGCRLEHLNGEQTGLFAHDPEPIEENLRDLSSLVANTPDVAFGCAQDPDADRLAIVDENGIFLGEEYTLVLAALRMLQRRGAIPLVTNLSTSRMIDDLAARFPGASVKRTAVGEANVVEGMRSCGSPLGGEGNGGVIVPEVGWVRDSLAAMALVLELLATEGRSLSSIVDEFPKYSMLKMKLDLSSISGRSAIDPALEKLRSHFASARITDVDGIRIDLDEGWAHVRASNTEPILRVITEASTPSDAKKLCQDVVKASGLD